MKQTCYLIVGSGFAGAATAFHLVRMGAQKVLILERENEIGRNSSGLNAAMVRQNGMDEEMEKLAIRGARFIRELPSGWKGAVEFSPNGSLFLASGEKLREKEAIAERARASGLDAEIRDRSWAEKRVPVLEGAKFEGALWCPSDGVVDIQALLEGYLESAEAGGAELWLGCEMERVEVRNGRVTAAETSRGSVKTEVLIDAAGTWAGSVAKMAGAIRLPLRTCSRHLFRTGELDWADPGWPFVWHEDASYYFRPEAGGLLLSPCDEDEFSPSLPEADLAARGLLIEKLRKNIPPLQWLRFEASWACLRTLSPDGRSVIGWDPKVEGFFWVAGLGGHGATCSGALGEMAARLILGRREDPGLDAVFSPDRFVRAG